MTKVSSEWTSNVTRTQVRLSVGRTEPRDRLTTYYRKPAMEATPSVEHIDIR